MIEQQIMTIYIEMIEHAGDNEGDDPIVDNCACICTTRKGVRPRN